MSKPVLLEQFAVNQRVSWLYTQPGGWNLQWYVPATILKIGLKRIQIAASLRDGSTKAVWVKSDNLRTEETT